MTTPRTIVLNPRLVTPSQSQNAPERRIYRERDFGIGYGRSSGYASKRQYVSVWNGQPLFRCS